MLSENPVPFKNILNLRTALLVMLVGIIAFLAYGMYQRFNTGQERLYHDTRRIEAMLTENDAKRH